MKEQVKVSLIQFNPEQLNALKNAERMVEFSKNEAEKGAELIVFPELVNIGIEWTNISLPKKDENEYNAERIDSVEYYEAAEPIPGPTTEVLSEVTKKYGVYIVVGMAEKHSSLRSGLLYNSAALIGPSGVIGVHHKIHMGLGSRKVFQPGDKAEVYDTELGKIGMIICFDSRFPELTRVLSLKGAEIITHSSATPVLNKEKDDPSFMFKARASVRAMENANYYLCCNRTGMSGNVYFFGHSAIGGPHGEIVAYSESDKENTLTATLSAEAISMAKSTLDIIHLRRPDVYTIITDPVA